MTDEPHIDPLVNIHLQAFREAIDALDVRIVMIVADSADDWALRIESDLSPYEQFGMVRRAYLDLEAEVDGAVTFDPDE